jgi:hypothetical protein
MEHFLAEVFTQNGGKYNNSKTATYGGGFTDKMKELYQKHKGSLKTPSFAKKPLVGGMYHSKKLSPSGFKKPLAGGMYHSKKLSPPQAGGLKKDDYYMQQSNALENKYGPVVARCPPNQYMGPKGNCIAKASPNSHKSPYHKDVSKKLKESVKRSVRKASKRRSAQKAPSKKRSGRKASGRKASGRKASGRKASGRKASGRKASGRKAAPRRAKK